MNKLPERIRIKDIARLADDISRHSGPCIAWPHRSIRSQPETGGRNIEATGLSAQYVCQRFGVQQKYLFVCLLPQHKEGDYWTDVEMGMKRAVETFSDFHTHPVRGVL